MPYSKTTANLRRKKVNPKGLLSRRFWTNQAAFLRRYPKGLSWLLDKAFARPWFDLARRTVRDIDRMSPDRTMFDVATFRDDLDLMREHVRMPKDFHKSSWNLTLYWMWGLAEHWDHVLESPNSHYADLKTHPLVKCRCSLRHSQSHVHRCGRSLTCPYCRLVDRMIPWAVTAMSEADRLEKISPSLLTLYSSWSCYEWFERAVTDCSLTEDYADRLLKELTPVYKTLQRSVQNRVAETTKAGSVKPTYLWTIEPEFAIDTDVSRPGEHRGEPLHDYVKTEIESEGHAATPEKIRRGLLYYRRRVSVRLYLKVLELTPTELTSRLERWAEGKPASKLHLNDPQVLAEKDPTKLLSRFFRYEPSWITNFPLYLWLNENFASRMGGSLDVNPKK